MKCVICEREIEQKGNWMNGNNAEPVKQGRCCDSCNMEKVLPARVLKMMESGYNGNNKQI